MNGEFGMLPTASIKGGMSGVRAAGKFGPFSH